MIDEDDHEHVWVPTGTDGMARCSDPDCVYQDPLTGAQRDLLDHWDECPAPPDAHCHLCHEAFRTVVRR